MVSADYCQLNSSSLVALRQGKIDDDSVNPNYPIQLAHCPTE